MNTYAKVGRGMIGRIMANYIDRNILCQAYVHVENVGLDEQELEKLKRDLEVYISTRGQFFLYEDIATDVELKDGSLKLYLTVAGALYIAIGQYGSFRDGVNFLAQDTKRLADCVVSESLFLTRSRHDDTIHVEARTGVVGTLKVIMDRLAFIREDMANASVETTNKRMSDLQSSIAALIGNLRDPADTPYVKDGLCEMVKELLPHSPTRGPRPNVYEEQAIIYRRQRAELISFLTPQPKK